MILPLTGTVLGLELISKLLYRCGWHSIFVGVRGAHKIDVKNEVFGDQGPGYFVRMILPPNSLSNVLTVRCNLAQEPGALAKQHLTIVAVHDSLWTMQYAAPAELPIETKVSPIT